MLNYKIELFTATDSFSGIYSFPSDDQKEVQDSIKLGLYNGLNEGLVPLITRRSETSIDEILYIPRDKVELIRITLLKIPESTTTMGI